MRTELLHSIENHRQEMLAFTESLITIATENPPGNCYAEAVVFLRGRLQQLGFSDPQVIGECVLAFIGEGTRTLYFSGHYDVVPAQAGSSFSPSGAAQTSSDAGLPT